MRRVVVIAALACSAGACGSSTPEQSAATPNPSASAATAQYFVVPEAQLSHLQIVATQQSKWQTTLHTTGTIDWDNDHTTQAITQVNGPITRIAVDTGATVKQGDPLLYVASPDIANAISTYRKAKNRLDLAQRTLDRDKDLLDHKAIAQRDMEGAEADFNDASTDLETALQTLKILGVTAADITDAEHQNFAIRPELPMRAPISGIVVQKLVFPGQFIQAGTTMAFVISNISTVWVQAHLYEKDLELLHVGDTADVHSASLPQTFHGTVRHIDNLVDPTTRTTLVRIVTDNPGGVLKKDMFVDVVMYDKGTREVLTVPTPAVLYDDQNLPFVYVQVDAGKFAQRTVTLGAQREDQTEITNGLKAGDKVVSQGSLFLQFASSFGK